MIFEVEYEHHVTITYLAKVKAKSKEEAISKIEDDMDFISEEEISWQGESVEVTDVKEG